MLVDRKKILWLNFESYFLTLGFQKIQTYFQRGNIVFQTIEENIRDLESKINEVIKITLVLKFLFLLKRQNNYRRILILVRF